MDITNQFIRLVTIASPSGREQIISTYLQKWLKSIHFTFTVDSVGNIYASNKKRGVPLLFCAHMDTVSPGENIKPIVTNGVIKSNGTTVLGADNKASIAAIMSAVESTPNERALELLFTVKEETGGGIDNLPFEWIKAKKALIFDSAKPLGGIVLGSPYITNFDIKFIGKAAHSSTPEDGINAFLPAFQLFPTFPIGNLDNGETTINIGLIKGGTGVNTIPDTIHMQGEIRSYNKKLFAKHIKNISNSTKLCAKKYGTKLHFELNGYCPGYAHKKEGVFISELSSILSDLNLPTTFYSHSGISDANILNEKGIETINLTDGVQFPHTTREQIAVKDLVKLNEVIKKCIDKL